MEKQLKMTYDGSATFYVPSLNEHYHSIHGAFNESSHVFIKNGYRAYSGSYPAVFEMGLGTGLNALLTALEAQRSGRPTTYYALEKYPVEDKLADQLNYHQIINETGAREIFEMIHHTPWEKEIAINPFFTLIKWQGDICELPLDIKADVVYFDAFAPGKQPTLWTYEVFKKMYDVMRPGGLLTTYCAKGDVRRTMQEVGFETERLPGPPGKREMLAALKPV